MNEKRPPISRREFLARAGCGLAVAPWLANGVLAQKLSQPPNPPTQPPFSLASADDRLLDDLEHSICRYFWEQADWNTGLVKDRSLATGSDDRTVGSIAATGFGLTALAIADLRGYFPSKNLRKRAVVTLRFLHSEMDSHHGFFFHFFDVRNGKRIWNCEVSSIDSAILLCGVLTCRQQFDEPEIVRLATQIYDRVDWPWMLNGGRCLSMGWKPESGFLRARWDTYAEMMMLYLLGLGSSTHPLPPESWDAWSRPVFHYEGLSYVGARAPLFIHQYSQAWYDFRGQRDAYADYFENSALATRSHRLFCLGLRDRFPDYGPNLWGITASDSQHGYVAWGGPPPMGPIDGTLVPAAPAGSLPFLPRQTLGVLHTMRDRFGKHVWKRYSFVDAFNPLKRWFDPDVIGIDLGISLLMAENLRSGAVWRLFMKNPEARKAMALAGFHSIPVAPLPKLPHAQP